MRRRWKGWWTAALFSVGLHAVMAVSALLWDPPRPDPVRPTEVEIRFVSPPVAEVAPVEPDVKPAAPEPKKAAPARKHRRRARPSRQPEATVDPGQGSAEGSIVLNETTPAGPPTVEGDVRDPSTFDLSVRSDVSTRPGLVPRPRGTPGGRRALRLRPRADGGYDIRDSQFSARITPDGAIVFKDKTALQRWHGLAYEIDVTDEVMRSVGQDPYLYEKRRLMKQTAELRARMADEACQARLKQSIVELRSRLEGVWQDSELAAERRRALLFGLWDDCAEGGDEEVVRHGEMARATILAFIRTHLPNGSPHAFTRHELDAFNRRRQSKVRFEPYLALQ